MNALKESEGIEEKTLRSYQSLVKLFTTLTGISDVRQIHQSNVGAFRAMLARLPKSWGKSPSDHTMSREDILDRATALPAAKVGLAVGTVNRHLEHLNQIVEWASDEGIEVDSRLKPTKLRRKEVQRERDRRSAFNHEDLRKLFSGPVWTGSKSAYYQTDPGEQIYKNRLYWVPMGSKHCFELQAGHSVSLLLLSGKAEVKGRQLTGPETVIFEEGQRDITVSASVEAHYLVLSGAPLNEPIAMGGPFVMNTEAEIRQAYADFRKGLF